MIQPPKIRRNGVLIIPIVRQNMIDVIYQKREPGFHQGFQFKHRETDETAECFYEGLNGVKRWA